MADTDTDTEGAPAAHGPAIAGKGKGHGKGILNGPHREEIIVVCSVIGVALAYLTFRKGSASAAGSTTPSAALSTFGPSASLGTGSGMLAGGGSAANAGLQQYLAQISDQLGGMEANLTSSQGLTPATPTPLAAGLLNPSAGGPLVRYGTSIDQVQADGSLLGLTLPQWQAMGSPMDFTQLGDATPSNLTVYTTAGNLQQKINTGASATQAAA